VKWLAGRLHEAPAVATWSSADLSVHGRDRAIRVSLDGEQRLMTPPLRYRLRPRGLPVLRPRGR
jgi:diacylglycerol kinase family enzyme